MKISEVGPKKNITKKRKLNERVESEFFDVSYRNDIIFGGTSLTLNINWQKVLSSLNNDRKEPRRQQIEDIFWNKDNRLGEPIIDKFEREVVKKIIKSSNEETEKILAELTESYVAMVYAVIAESADNALNNIHSRTIELAQKNNFSGAQKNKNTK